jgi:hypothetical protein
MLLKVHHHHPLERYVMCLIILNHTHVITTELWSPGGGGRQRDAAGEKQRRAIDYFKNNERV